MKISKLFHWLYATLMFLPLVFFIPSVFYYGFNEHATNTETTTINYKYESNEVNTLDDLVVGNIYSYETMGWVTGEFDDDYQFTLDVYYYSELRLDYLTSEIDEIYVSYFTTPITRITFTDQYLYIKFTNNDTYIAYYFNNYDFGIDDLVFSLDEYEIDNYKYFVDNYYDLPQYTDYNVIESVSVNTDDTISDKLNRSWNAIFDLPMFSWTKTTFVSGAFVYISGLFGVQANNPLNYLFAYFVSISICWLVFDVLLYVPNLAHRWLDKGAIE